VGVLAEIGINGIWQIDRLSGGGQRFADFTVAAKKTGQGDERTGGVFETAHVTECLQGVEGEHLFPGDIIGCCEAKKIDQDEGMPGDGATEAMGSYGRFPLKIVHDGSRQHPDVFIAHRVPPEGPGA